MKHFLVHFLRQMDAFDAYLFHKESDRFQQENEGQET